MTTRKPDRLTDFPAQAFGRTAAILAGGLGTRLRSVVSDRPKVLAPVNGRPFVTYLFDQLLAFGIRRLVLCTGHGADALEATFGTRYRDASVTYSRETTPLGTGGALQHALEAFDEDPVLVLNGDSYCSFHLDPMLQWHAARGSRLTIWLTSTPNAGRFGQVQLASDGRIEQFLEKSASPPTAQGGSPQTQHRHLINAGIYLVSLGVLADISPGATVSLEREVFPSLIGDGLYGYAGGGELLDIGTPESYTQASQFLSACEGRQQTE